MTKRRSSQIDWKPGDPPRRYAYADPPYLGMSYLYEENTEVDHVALIARLVEEFPDGWALSCHAPSLRILLPICPPGIRLLSWVKPWAAFRPGVNPAYAWEPVIVHGGRRKKRYEPTVRDWLSCNPTKGKGMAGVKPDQFSFWIFDALGMLPDDEFVDLFPGSGAVSRAWESWRRREDFSTLPMFAKEGVDTAPVS